jgi:hypothetical protein
MLLSSRSRTEGLGILRSVRTGALGPGLAAGLFCAINLDSNSAVSRIGETPLGPKGVQSITPACACRMRPAV